MLDMLMYNNPYLHRKKLFSPEDVIIKSVVTGEC